MIYVLAEVDPFDGEVSKYVKIGFVEGEPEPDSMEQTRRMEHLQCGNPRRMVVIGLCAGTLKDEQALHFRFSEWRIRQPRSTEKLEKTRPTEWFYAEGEVAQWIESVRVASADDWTLPAVKVTHGATSAALKAQAKALRVRADAAARRATKIEKAASDAELVELVQMRQAKAREAWKARSERAEERQAALEGRWQRGRTGTIVLYGVVRCSWCGERGHARPGCPGKLEAERRAHLELMSRKRSA